LSIPIRHLVVVAVAARGVVEAFEVVTQVFIPKNLHFEVIAFAVHFIPTLQTETLFFITHSNAGLGWISDFVCGVKAKNAPTCLVNDDAMCTLVIIIIITTKSTTTRTMFMVLPS